MYGVVTGLGVQLVIVAVVLMQDEFAVGSGERDNLDMTRIVD
jgi:hypothetical protein